MRGILVLECWKQVKRACGGGGIDARRHHGADLDEVCVCRAFFTAELSDRAVCVFSGHAN